MAITYSATVNQETITVTGGTTSGTATSGSTTTLNDTGKSWTVNAYAGRKVWIHSGTGAGQMRRIESNTATQLVPTVAFTTAPDSTSVYVVSYNFADIQSASTVGGWGRAATQGSQIRITANIVVGDASTYSLLADEKKDIEIIIPSGFPNVYTTFLIYDRARFSIGNVDINNKPYDGCKLLIDSSACVQNLNLFGVNTVPSSGAVYFYDSFLRWLAASTKYLFMRTQANIEWVGNNISGHRGGRFSGSGSIMINNKVHDGLVQGFSFEGAIAEASGFYLYREDKAFKIFNFYGAVLTDAIFENNTYDFYVDTCTTATAVLTDCLHDGSGIVSDSKLLRQQPVNVWTGYLEERKTLQLHCIDASNADLQDVRIAIYNAAGTLLFNDVTDSAGLHTLQTIPVTNRVAGGSATTFTKTTYNPFTVKYRKYGYVITLESLQLELKTRADRKIATNTYVVANEATAAAYTGISIDGGLQTITVSGTRTIQELYDYSQWWTAQSSNVGYNEPLSTIDGVTFALYSGWSIVVSGSLASTTKIISGTITVSSGGFYEDSLGAKWELSGNVYYASPISYITKDAGTPVANVEVAHFDSGGNNRTYNSSHTSVTSLTSNGSGVVSGYAVWKINSTSYASHTLKARQYGYLTYTSPKTLSGTPISEDLNLSTDSFEVANEATASAITGISLNYGTKVATVSGTRTIQEFFDYLRYSIALQANISYDDPFVTTDGVTYTLAVGWSISVSGSLTSLTHIISGTVGVVTAGFFEHKNGVVWIASGNTYYASHGFIQVLDGGTASPIQNAAIGFGDLTTQTKLMYNTSLTQTGLLTDATGKAEGYLVYKINSTTYANTKMVVGEYNYQFLTVPRTLTGIQVGTSASYEVNRLSTDAQVTLSKAAALAITGVSVTHASKLVNGGDVSLSNLYDHLKAIQASISDIETGIPGCLSFCLYGLLLTKTGTNYTAIDDWTYSNVGDSGKFYDGKIIFDAPGVMFGDYENVNFEFSVAGTYDFRSTSIIGTSILTNTSGSPVTVQVYPGTSYTNTGPSITVEASISANITIANLIDGTRVRIYNVTQDFEIDNSVVSGGAGYTFAATLGTGYDAEIGDIVSFRATYTSGSTAAKIELSNSGAVTASGLGFFDVQIDDTVYTSWAIDGSTITEFITDFPNIQVDISDPDGATEKKRLGAWMKYIVTTADGIRNYFGALTTPSVSEMRINTAIVDLKLDNVSGFELQFTDNDVRLYRDDFTQIIASGSDSIFLDYEGVPFVVGEVTGSVTLSNELLDNQDIETGYSLREAMRICLAALAGKVSGAGTGSIVMRDLNDTKDRITASVDVDGNRLSVTKDVT